MRSIKALLGAGAVVAVSISALVWAGVPAGKATVKIHNLPGHMGAVTLPMAEHVDKFKGPGGRKIVCKDCHHTLKGPEPAAGEKVQACIACHVVPPAAQKTYQGKKVPYLAQIKNGRVNMRSVIYHKRCRDGCHKTVSKERGLHLTSCKTCHKK